MNTITGSLLNISILTLMVGACSSSIGGEVSNPQLPVIPIYNPCDNIYFPVKSGATWTYTGSSNLVETISFTNTISEVRPDEYTLTSTYNNLNQTQQWACKPDGLVALTFGGGPAGGISTQGIDVEITTTNVAGVSIPTNLQPGGEWNYSLDLAGSVMLPDGQKGQAQGTMTTPMKAIGMESVSVPAGTFEALRVEGKPSIHLTATYLGLPIPVSFTGNVTLWFARGVGWIKSTESGEFFGNSINSNIELQSFQIP